MNRKMNSILSSSLIYERTADLESPSLVDIAKVKAKVDSAVAKAKVKAKARTEAKVVVLRSSDVSPKEKGKAVRL